MKVSDLKFDPKEIAKQVKARKATSALVRVGRAHQDKTQYNRKKVDRQFRKEMYEQRIITNVRLSDHQKAVLAAIVSNGDRPSSIADITAGIDPSNKQNISAAITALTQIGMITQPEDGEPTDLVVSDRGMKAMEEQNLVDPSTGSLTPDGEAARMKFAMDTDGKTQGDVGQEMSFQGEPPLGGEPMGMDMGMGEPPPMESNTFLGMLSRGLL